MSLTELAPILAIAALALAGVAVVLLIVVYNRLKRIQRAQRVVLGSRGDVDVVTHVTSLDDKVTNLRSAVENLGLESRDHEVRIDGCLSRMGIVRFDAFHDLGGRQSTTMALLDARENGIVVTTAVSREFSRMYVKAIHDGQSDIPLAPEEIEAIDAARATAPFTIRPRLEQAKEEGEEAPPADEIPAPEVMTEAATRALERENRRRARQGLPALEELPPAPSTLGWPTPEPLAASSDGSEGPEGESASDEAGDPSANDETPNRPVEAESWFDDEALEVIVTRGDDEEAAG
jgi:hypothetical protein